MIFGSVCSGIEAASAAWLPLGWECSFMSEIEPFPRAVLAHHYPETPLHGDFTTIEPGRYRGIDLLVGGTPCQSFSVAGLRGGLDDDRGNLALEYLRLADRLCARWLVWENVPGVLSSNEGRDFGAILGGLVELGYGFAYRVLDAQFFGVAQRRRRVFVVGHLGDWRRAAAVLFERHGLQGHPAPRRETRERATTCFGGGPEGGSLAGNVSSKWAKGTGGPAGDECYNLVAFTSNDDGANAGVPPAIAFALRGRDGGAMAEVGGDQVGSLRAASGGSSRDYVAFAQRGRGDEAEFEVGDELSNALRQSPGSAYSSGVIGPSAVRRLTPRECERLQGFPDDFTLIPWRKGMASDGPRYKALGNSMAVPVMRWLGERIQKVDELSAIEVAA